MIGYREKTLAAAVVYLATLEFAYGVALTKYWTYLGFVDAPLPLLERLALYLIALAPLFVLRVDLHKPSSINIALLIGIVQLPMAVALANSQQNDVGFAFRLTVIYSCCFVALATVSRLYTPRRMLRFASMNRSTFVGFLWAATSVGLVVMVAVGGLNIRLDLLSELGAGGVGDARVEAKDSLGGVPLFARYAISMTTKLLLPLCVAAAVLRGRSRERLIAAALVLFAFSFAAQRSVLFFGAMVAILVVGVRSGRRWVAPAGFIGATAAVFASCSMVILTGNLDMFSLVVRRTLFMPGLLTMRYFELFSEVPHTGFAGGALGFLEAEPAPLPAATQVGNAYFIEGSNANANVIADSFARFGYSGIVIAVVVLATLFCVLDTLSVRGRPGQVSLAYGAAIVPGLILSNTGLVTSLVANGLLLGPLILLYAPRWVGASAFADRSDPSERADDGVAGTAQQASR